VTRPRSWGLACAALGAAGFSLKAIFVKVAYRYGVDTETLLALRMLYSLPLFLLLGWATAAPTQQPLTRQDLGALAILGVLGYYASSYLDFLGLRLISASLERMILFVHPTLVVLLVAWHRRRWPGSSVWQALVLCYLGVALAVAHDLRGEAAPTAAVWQGALLVFGSAVSYAFYLERAGQILPRIGSARFAAWATGIACLLAVLQFLLLRPVGSIIAQPWQVQALSAGMAVVSTVLPIWLMSEALRVLGAGSTAIVGSLGPVLTMLLAWAVLGESVSALQLVGLGLVIAGVQRVARAG
jgi:drug/metabolite transporter (DMT)-like permease